MLSIGKKLKIPSTPTAEMMTVAAKTTVSPATTDVVPDEIPVIDRSTYVYSEEVTTEVVADATPAAPDPTADGATSPTYTVSKGDTLWKIARRFNTTPSAIAAANGINDPTKLGIGDKLRIPNSEARNAVSAPEVRPATRFEAPPAPSADLVRLD